MKQKKSTIRFLKKAARPDRHKPDKALSGKAHSKKKVRFADDGKDDLVAEEIEPPIIKVKGSQKQSNSSKRY